ncbi:HK97 family phage prohead protease [Roseovarius sp. LXJ103]|uniref:HK97 family phage prohead protease n=1 Tax=Roseovarius carneus TaxID=2853164 RepID=UPI000D622A2E|nr:HK97 family phage prohead protease [Roseovarius carneus]MBZ8118509.1 HK97 family phage prohead protease [Roseovarius carneus]PWE35796.1 HK97 family phage prohead protease [Pelagicola sp. LXJ1103]
MSIESGLEKKFARLGKDLTVTDGTEIAGYASYFGDTDQSGDVVQKGAYAVSLKALAADGRQVKMLWQHDPAQPIGIWDEVCEDARGLYVKGRLLEAVGRGREAAALIAAGAIDGLSIGYRTVKAAKNEKGQRLLMELELWEVSLVTFPMLPSARVGAKGESLMRADLRELAATFAGARRELARM